MPERPDLRQIAVSLRESLDGLEREALVDILTYVLNEYVVEGPPPLHAAQVEKLEDLQGLSLAQLVQALQVRLDTPGLELLKVEGDEVRVQTGGGWVPLTPGRAPAASERTAAPAPAAAPAPQQRAEGRPGAQFDERGFVPPGRSSVYTGRDDQPSGVGPRQAPPAARQPESSGRASVDEAALRGRGDLGGGERGVITPPAPRPRGVSVNGRATSGAAPSSPPSGPQPPAQQPPGQQPPAAAQPAAPQSPAADRKDDDASSIRFSLLELD